MILFKQKEIHIFIKKKETEIPIKTGTVSPSIKPAQFPIPYIIINRYLTDTSNQCLTNI